MLSKLWPSGDTSKNDARARFDLVGEAGITHNVLFLSARDKFECGERKNYSYNGNQLEVTP